MKSRCLDINNPAYKNYGGRGIRVCKTWLAFVNFHKDMGDRPKGKTLDRIDNNGNYCKDNCRWITRQEQQENRRDSVYVTINGVKSSIPELARVFNMKRHMLYNRLFVLGWSLKRALLTKQLRF